MRDEGILRKLETHKRCGFLFYDLSRLFFFGQHGAQDGSILGKKHILTLFDHENRSLRFGVVHTNDDLASAWDGGRDGLFCSGL